MLAFSTPTFGQSCSDISDNVKRLDCYDRAAKQARPTRQQLMGEDACAVLAAYAAAPGPDWPPDGDAIKKAQLCEFAEKETCEATKEFVQSRGSKRKPRLVLNCKG